MQRCGEVSKLFVHGSGRSRRFPIGIFRLIVIDNDDERDIATGVDGIVDDVGAGSEPNVDGVGSQACRQPAGVDHGAKGGLADKDGARAALASNLLSQRRPQAVCGDEN